MENVALIAAIGRRGQIGLAGALPWHNPADLKWFKQQTMGGVVVVGGNTFATLPALPDRIVACYSSKVGLQPKHYLESLRWQFPGKTIWIAGGAKTYETFLPFVERSVISHIDYDGPADTFMPKLWSE